MGIRDKATPDYTAMTHDELCSLWADNIEQQNKLTARSQRVGEKAARMNVMGIRALWAQVRLDRLSAELTRIERALALLEAESDAIDAELTARNPDDALSGNGAVH